MDPDNGLNAYVVGVVSYGAGILDWTKEKLLNIYRKTKRSWQLMDTCPQGAMLQVYTYQEGS